MTRLEKNAMYDEVCYHLTRYECPEDFEGYDNDVYDFVDTFYKLLVKVTNNWELITGEDD